MGVGYAAPISPIGAPTATSAEHVGSYLGHRVEPVARHMHAKQEHAAAARSVTGALGVSIAASSLPAASVREGGVARPGVSIDLSSHSRTPALPRPSYQEAVRGVRKSVSRKDLRINKLQLHEEVPEIHDEDSVLPDKAIAVVRQRDLESRGTVQLSPEKHAQAESVARFEAVKAHMATRAASDPRSLARPKIGLTSSARNAEVPVAKASLIDALISVLTGMHVSESGTVAAESRITTIGESQVDAAVRALVRSLHADPRNAARVSSTTTAGLRQSSGQSAFYALRRSGLQPLAAPAMTRLALAA